MNSKKELYLSCKDYTVSNKQFDLLYNENLEMLETFPQPKGEELDSYYESDDYISHTDSKKSITDKLYQTVKKLALKKKLSLLNSFKTSGKEVLDIGCGTGDFLLTCKKNQWNVVGIEPNKNARELAETKLNAKIYGDLNELPSVQFDIITLWHVLEHVPDLETYISKLKLMLKPNGFLVVAVPNYKSYDAMYYKQFWAAFDVPRHLWHFSKKSIQLLFSKQQLEVKKILPMKFDSFYVSLLSEQYKTGANNFIKAFYVGLVSNLRAMTTKEYSSLIYIIKKEVNRI